MQTAIIQSDSKADLKLILELAKKLNIKAKILTKSEIEDIGLANAIKTGATSEFVDVDAYIEKIKS